MYTIRNIEGEQHKITQQNGIFAILEHLSDESIAPNEAMQEYYRSKMNIRKRQLIAQIDDDIGLTLQKGAMQWMAGDVEFVTGIKPTKFLNKWLKSTMTQEESIKPEYAGNGIIVTEPTYEHLLIEDVEDWDDGLVLQDGMFLACESTVDLKLHGRKTLSAALAAKEGLFNLKLTGSGYCVLKSCVPKSELIEIELNDDVLKIDGNLAICWSASLTLSVEKSGKTLIGSAIAKEGLVNVYRGSGRVLMAPLKEDIPFVMSTPAPKDEHKEEEEAEN